MSALTIIIPAYNEEESLSVLMPELLSFVQRNNMQLVVVNDGSKDRTLEVLRKFENEPNFRFFSHKVNKGYGGAIKTGIRNANTEYSITIDADGQHDLADVKALLDTIQTEDADMVVGSRMAHKNASLYRGIGKSLIRWFAKLLLPIHINDINSGMKIYNTELAKRYIRLCPDHMAFSDIIAMVFISKRHLVLEQPINIKPRTAGVSTISTLTAIETVKEILNIVILFNPMRVFFPIAFLSIAVALAWGIPIALRGRGVSTGAMLGVTTGLLFFFLGLLAEQLSQIRKDSVDE
ncbi:MAG: glycosyltransferase family 2 protein [Flavobacteriales bacterium]|nr:glycosyltransferase family 2 protein [Flavobacteriales bacterium]MCB9203360.1 glycosyltransferase family 2 protein [Flavobacteriales bacterium]